MGILHRYNRKLAENPLLIKALTGAVLASMGELTSHVTTELFLKEQQGILRRLLYVCKITAQHASKILLMFCYGGFINAPINHFLYGWIIQITNRKITGPKLKKLVQLLASLTIVSPIQVGCLISALTVVNQSMGRSLSKYPAMIKENLKVKYFKILSSSLLTSTILVSIAQKYVSPEKWSVFFNVAYALLGTGQNIYLKIASAK